MKKLFLFVLCVCLCVSLLSGCGISQDDLDEAWEDGHVYGYESGYEAGYDEGYREAESECEDNDEDNYMEGYNSGYEEGYQAGATYTCLFYGDVDRAFKCAYKGSSWGTFIDAYDQYISNIYDDRETKSKLFWAFVSLKSGDGLTTEERELLIDTFGKDFFTRNDIDL